jgi:Protein of unknown function (DUF1573)
MAANPFGRYRLPMGIVLVILLTGASLWLWRSLKSGSQAENGSRAPRAAAGPARAFFPETTHAFGPVMVGDTVSCDLAVENPGQGPLVITQVRAEPGYARALPPGPIPAGAKGKIHVTIHAPRRGGQALIQLLADTNDPGRPRIAMALEGKVEPYVEMPPAGVYLSGRLGDKISSEVRIKPHRDHPFIVTGAKASMGKDIRFDLQPAGEPVSREGYTLKVTSTRRTPGVIVDFIELNTDSRKVPLIKLPVRGKVEAPEPASETK